MYFIVSRSQSETICTLSELIVKFDHDSMLKRNNTVIPWPSHHALVSLTSTGVRRTEANTNRLSTKMTAYNTTAFSLAPTPPSEKSRISMLWKCIRGKSATVAGRKTDECISPRSESFRYLLLVPQQLFRPHSFSQQHQT